jgi:hypothetical protein
MHPGIEQNRPQSTYSLSSCLSLCMLQKLSDQLVSAAVKGLGMVYHLLIPGHEAIQRLRLIVCNYKYQYRVRYPT